MALDADRTAELLFTEVAGLFFRDRVRIAVKATLQETYGVAAGIFYDHQRGT